MPDPGPVSQLQTRPPCGASKPQNCLSNNFSSRLRAGTHDSPGPLPLVLSGCRQRSSPRRKPPSAYGPWWSPPRSGRHGFKSERLRSRRRAVTTPPLARRTPAPPPRSVLHTRSASKHSRALSARLAVPLPDLDAIAKGDVLAVHLDKQAHRDRCPQPEQLTAFSFSVDSCFLRRLRDNGVGHVVHPFVVRASGCLPAPPGPFSRLASWREELASEGQLQGWGSLDTPGFCGSFGNIGLSGRRVRQP
jgi:hypothetical protein